MFQKDKLLHFSICFLITLTLSLSLHALGIPEWISLTTATLTSLLIGIAKELHDKYIISCSFDMMDLLADTLGILVALAACLSLFFAARP